MTGQTNEPGRYDYLNNLSVEELERLLQVSRELHRADEDEYIDAIAEVMIRKEKERPTGRLPDVDQAWEEFQTQYDTPEGKGLSLFPDDENADMGVSSEKQPTAKKPRAMRIWKCLAAAAILVVCITAILPPALGYVNIFEMLGHWNETVFHFALPGQEFEPPADEVNDEYESLQAALDANGVTAQLAPKIPAEYEATDVCVTRYPKSERIDYNALYEAGERSITVYIIQRETPTQARAHEKDETPVQIYAANGIDHYIFENNGRVSATWCFDVFECSIQADMSEEEVKELIHSIYEGQ